MSRTPALDGLKEMRRLVAAVPSPQAEQERRERIVARLGALQGELSSQRQRNARLRRGVLLAALVSAVLAVSVLVSRAVLFPSAALPVAASPAASPAGAASELTARIVAGHLLLKEGEHSRPWSGTTLDLAAATLMQAPANEGVDLELPSAAAVEVAAQSELALVRHKEPAGWRERVELRAGRVRLRVPKLGAGASLAVQTRDALVEVRGTRFSVAVVAGENGAAHTRVEVEEGRVAVTSARGQEFVGPGEVWSSAAAAQPAAERLDAGAAEAVTRTRTPAAPRRAVPPSAPAPTPEEQASALAEQNRLFQGAALAKKRRLPKLALGRLETLMQSYPESELAHNARVEHFRLLRELGQRERAQASARAYLERYPAGFARREAEELERAEAPSK